MSSSGFGLYFLLLCCVYCFFSVVRYSYIFIVYALIKRGCGFPLLHLALCGHFHSLLTPSRRLSR
jgi:hypothetical protein